MESASVQPSPYKTEDELRALPDEDLVRELGSTRDGRCLMILMERYEPLVGGAAMRILGNDDRWKDVVQVTFVKVFEHASAFEGGNFKAWLFQIAKRTCFDQLRARTFEVLPDENTLRADGGDELLRVILQEGLAHLGREQRICLKLLYGEGRTYKEIASVTGYDAKSVRSHIENGRARLRRFLEREQGEGVD